MAKRRTTEDRRAAKYEALLTRTARIWDCDQFTAEQMLSSELRQSVRINPLAGEGGETLRLMKEIGWKGTAIPWCEEGYTIDEGFEQLRDSELVKTGRIYIQNQSSWLPVIALDPQSGERVLDICAAPGGKTSHIAARIGNQGELVANDNSRARLMKLQANMTRLSARAEYMLYDATRLAILLDGRQFDKILLDAPCSGEGLINLMQLKSLDSWSVAHIRRLSTLQKRILNQAWQLLTPGGRIVYSTCTMAPEEDELVIDWLLARQNDASVGRINIATDILEGSLNHWNDRQLHEDIQNCRRVRPGSGAEAFFIAVLEKSS